MNGMVQLLVPDTHRQSLLSLFPWDMDNTLKPAARAHHITLAFKPNDETFDELLKEQQEGQRRASNRRGGAFVVSEARSVVQDPKTGKLTMRVHRTFSDGSVEVEVKDGQAEVDAMKSAATTAVKHAVRSAVSAVAKAAAERVKSGVTSAAQSVLSGIFGGRSKRMK